MTTRRCGTTRSACAAGAAASTSPPPPSTPTSATCRSPPTPAPARRASCSTCRARTRWASRPSCRREPVEGLDLSISGSVHRGRVRFRRDHHGRRGHRRHSRGQPAADRCRTSRSRPAPATPSRSADGAEAYVGASFQHVGSRYTQPSDQENNPRTFVHGLPFGGAPANAATTLDLRLPSYDYVNLSAGIDWDNGLGVMVYVNNLFDENALLSFDRERGGRARLGFNVGQPRIIGITRAQALRQRELGRPANAGSAAAPCSSPERGRRSPLAACPAGLAAQTVRTRRWDVGRRRRRRVRRLDGEAAAGGRPARAAARRLGAGPCPRLLGRGIADDPRRLRRRRGLHAHGAGLAARMARPVGARRPADLPRDRRALLRSRDRRLFSSRSIAVHRRLGLPTELLDGAALRAPLPEIDFTGIEAGLYEPRLRRADGAPRGADPGRRVRPRRRRLSPGRGRCRRRAGRRLGDVVTAGRRAASPPTASSSPAGPGSAGSFPSCSAGASSRPGRRCSSSRPRPGDTRFAPGRLPGWADFNGGDIYYGFPDLEGRGFKIAHDAHGPPIDPDTRRPHPLGRRRWPTCAPSWPAASRASPTARSARRGSANMRTARTATS